MAFGKKTQAGPAPEQDQVASMALAALGKLHSTRLTLAMRLVTTSPMLMHRWGQKSFIEMLHKMVKGVAMPRGHKDLTADYEQSWYRNEQGVLCVPCRMLKAAFVEGAMGTDGMVTKADIKRQLRVVGHTTRLVLPKGQAMSMDVRIADNNGSKDIRARAVIPAGATMDILLSFSPLLPVDKAVAVVGAAGEIIGLCDWRPDRGGDFGTFRIDHIYKGTAAERAAIAEACSVPEESIKIPEELLRAFAALPDEALPKAGKSLRKIIQNGGAVAS